MSERSFRRAANRRREASIRRRRRVGALAASATVAAGAFGLAPGAQAANYQVNSLGDGPITLCDATCTLRDAVGSSNNDGIDDVITFQSGLSGTIRLTNGSLHPIGAESLEIRGPGDGQIVVSGDTNSSGVADAGDTRPFIITATTEMSGLTVEDGYASNGPGGAIWSVGELTLRDMVIRDSDAGNILASTPTDGGGLAAEGPSTLVTGSTFDNNYGIRGGGIWATRKLTLRDSTLVGNEAYGGGGGLEVNGTYAQAEVTNTTVSGNTAEYGGGIDFVIPAPVLGPSDPNIDSVVSRSTISDNEAHDGGGIRFTNLGSNGEVRVEQSTISGNDAVFGGGLATNPSLRVNKVRVVTSTISENVVTGHGGAASIHKAADFDFENSTIAGNIAGLEGGGIRLGTYPAPEPPNDLRTASVGLGSTIVGFNFAGANPNDLQQGPGATAGGFQTAFSLITAPGSASIVETVEGTTQLNIDAGLGILTDNGGPTLTHTLSADSPAVDAGDSGGLGVDQTGRPRTVDRSPANRADGTDIGAVELPPDPLPPVAAVEPNTKITNKPAPKQKTATDKKVLKNITFVSNVEGSRFECRVNGGPFKPCTSPLRLLLPSSLGKGRFHLIQIRAIGPTGLVETQPAQFGVRIRRTKK
jgi:hypothetical protein